MQPPAMCFRFGFGPAWLLASLATHVGACERPSNRAGDSGSEVLPPSTAPNPFEPVPEAPVADSAVAGSIGPASESGTREDVGHATKAPHDYGAVRPPEPPPTPDELTVHGLAGYEVVTIYAAPNLASARLGHLRIGQRLRVTAALPDQGSGCPRGFHALPTGGYACASKGLLVDPKQPPYMHIPPPPPRVETPHPYTYAAIARDGTPMWWRTATEQERVLAEQKYQASLPPEERAPPPDLAQAATALPGVQDDPQDLEPSGVDPLQADPLDPAEAEREAAQQAELARKLAELPLHPGTPFMAKGNIVSVGGKTREKGLMWLRTARGGYVEASRTYGKKAKDFAGVVLKEDTEFPFGFVHTDRGVGYQLTADGTFERGRKLEYREFFDLEPEPKEVGDQRYYKTTEEPALWIRESALDLAKRRDMPTGVEPWEHWIDVDLKQQLLVAYEGTRPVFATLVSTGKKGTEKESFRTPTGQWRIQSKHISSSMAGSTASDGDYSIQDVPWTMFFEGNYALHGAFWHTRFGRTRSHGCVNLGPSDARWLFYWTTPSIPKTWHGVKSQPDSPGSMVVIHD